MARATKLKEVGRLIAQDQHLLVQTGVFEVILNLPPVQLHSNLYYQSLKYQKPVINCTHQSPSFMFSIILP